MVFQDINKMRSYWTQRGPDTMTGVLIRRGNFGHRHTLKEDNHVMAEADFGVATTTTQRMLRIAGNQEIPQESRKDSSCKPLQEEARPCWHFDF